jgi:hypothetical protein
VCVDGQQLNVDTFNNKTARDSYLKSRMTFGGIYGQDDLWVIHGDDVGSVTKAVAAAGGALS